MADRQPAFPVLARPDWPSPRPCAPPPVLLSTASLPCGRFRLDPARRLLLDAAGCQVELRPKTFDVLHLLLQRADRLVTREELLDLVWGEVHVTDDSVTQCVVEIRRALGEAAGVRIRTLPRRGYLLEQQPLPVALPEPAEVVVLPFLDVEAGRPGAIGAALCDLLAVELARGGTVRVVARQWMHRRPGQRRGRAPHLLRGSIWRAGDRLRVIAQLVDGATGRLVWAERYDGLGAGAALLDAGDDIAGRIVRGAGAAFAGLQAAGPPQPGGTVLRLASRG
jgi:DNA-binding winged helix-turn-helix (wHTH) protein